MLTFFICTVAFRLFLRHSGPHAFAVGVATGVTGVGMLLAQVNPLVAALGFSNIILYAAAYTYTKRTTLANTVRS